MAEKKTSNGSKNSTGKSSSAKKSAYGKKKSSGRSSTKTNVNRIVKAAKKYDTDKSFKDNQDAVLDVISATATSAKRASNKKQKKIFTSCTLDRELIYKIYKDFTKLDINKTKNPG